MDKAKKIVKLGNLSAKGSESGEVFYRGGVQELYVRVTINT